MLRIAICDDLLSDRIRLRKDIEVYFGNKEEKAEVCLYESGDELIEVMKRENFAIVFMDVYMEGISGVETSRQLRKMGKDCAIIFTTTSPEHAMEGYAVRASDYLVKPYRQEEVFQALDYVLEQLRNNGSNLEATQADKLIRLPVGEILFLEDLENGCCIGLISGEKVTVQNRLQELLMEEKEELYQCHRKYAVNAAHVARPVENAVKMDRGERIPMDDRYAGSFQKTFYEWVFRKTYGGQG